MKKVIVSILIVVGVLAAGLFLSLKVIMQDTEFGGDPRVSHIDQLKRSAHFKEGHFHNNVKERDYDIWVNIKDMMGDQVRKPPSSFPIVKPIFAHNVSPGLRAIWFGHASVLVEIDGHRVFFDPMLSQYAFPVKVVAPERMNPSPLPLKELPQVDAVVVSHDHYDHLDMKTAQYLSQQGAVFFVGLGVGAHLEKWGISKDKIHELDWGNSFKFKNLIFNCTEARHYSGRKSMSKDTLWTSWVIQGPEHTIFHSGDSGYSPHFKKIGEAFPGIDVGLIKVGDYGLDLGWQDIHMVPENSVKSQIDIGAKVMLPIHWGVFQLSNHDWNEPIERTIKAAKKEGVALVTPKIGEVVEFGKPYTNIFWWREL